MSLMNIIFDIIVSLCSSAFADRKEVVIGISQIIEHPALDEEREGMLAKLKEAGYVEGKNLKVVYENAQGNISTSAQIAQKLASQNPTVLVAISTPSAQSLKAVAVKNQIPLVFTAVSDPVVAKLVSSLDVSEEYTTGVTDRLPLAPQLELIKQVVPAVKKLGVIYNSGEVNSVSAINELKHLATEHSIEIVEAIAQNTADVAPAVNKLIASVDAIFIPNDNTAVAAIETIVKMAHDAKIPVFAGDSGSIKRGALAGLVFDRYELGKKVGQMILNIIEKQPLTTVKVEKDHPLTLMINKRAAANLNLTLPTNAQQNVKMVDEQ